MSDDESSFGFNSDDDDGSDDFVDCPPPTKKAKAAVKPKAAPKPSIKTKSASVAKPKPAAAKKKKSGSLPKPISSTIGGGVDANRPCQKENQPTSSSNTTLKGTSKSTAAPPRSSLGGSHSAPKQQRAAGSGGSAAGAKKTVASKSNARTSTGTKSAPKISLANADAAVFEYMKKTNRPYSALNVYDNMHKSLPKPAVMSALAKLAQSGELVEKEYGKSKIYFVDQKAFPQIDPEAMRGIQASLDEKAKQLADAKRLLHELESERSKIRSTPSDADLATTLATAQADAAALQERVKKLTGAGGGGKNGKGVKPFSPGRRKRMEAKYDKYRSTWVSRKRMVVDCVADIADSMEKKKADVLEVCGVETDDDVGVKLPDRR